MLIIFPLYAAFVWYACYRWRRRWFGYASIILGVFGVSVLWSFDILITRALQTDFPPVLFQLLLCSEAGLIMLVGAYLASLPREHADLPCRACRYELAGLEAENPQCPECGLREAVRLVRRRACRGCGFAIVVGRPLPASCPCCTIAHPICGCVRRAVMWVRALRLTRPSTANQAV